MEVKLRKRITKAIQSLEEEDGFRDACKLPRDTIDERRFRRLSEAADRLAPAAARVRAAAVDAWAY